MESIKDLLNLFTAAMLIILGWLLGEFSSVFHSWLETRKKLKSVLYYLLEFHYHFSFFDIDKFIDMFIKKITNKYPDAVMDESELKTARNSITPFILRFIKNFGDVELSKIKSNYQVSVEELASINPFRAFSLSGRSRIFDISDTIEKLFVEAGKLTGDLEEEEVARKFRRYLEEKTYNEAKKELELAIKDVALKIGPIIYLKSLRYLDRANRRRPREIEIEFEKYLNSLPDIIQGK